MPSVRRSGRSQAAAKLDALASNGMDEIEIPAFPRTQADREPTLTVPGHMAAVMGASSACKWLIR
jgi:hypothetical protein